ncbi:MAG: glycosyltransferase family 39 protein [Vicingaceae bacterium]
MRFKPVHLFLIFFLLNLVQASFTPIARDEAYYWMFGQHLDWGYFDHPPFVALMTYLGSALFNGVLGVRFLTLIMATTTAYFIWLLIPESNRQNHRSLLVFSLVFLANPLFNLYGFITTPDAPLLFFSAAYFLAFQRFTKNQSFLNSLLLGFLMSALIYSKYHGILVILISVLSHIQLFKKPWIYVSAFVGVVLYTPHLIWQYDHHFVSFNYHLFYRSTRFDVLNILDYLLNLVLVLNPVMLPFFIAGIRKTRGFIQSRLLTSIFWGFFLFFLLTSARGHVEPHWMAIACIPYTIQLVNYITVDEGLWKKIKLAGIFSIAIISILRIVAFLPLPIKSEFHVEKKEYFDAIKERAEGRKVVFVNSYTDAAKYSFYTGENTFSYNFISFRKNQYDLLDVQNEFHMKRVMLTFKGSLKRFDEQLVNKREAFYYNYYDSFPVLNNIHVEVLDYPTEVIKGSRNKIRLRVTNPYDHQVVFKPTGFPVLWELFYFYMDKERQGGVSLEEVPISIMDAHSEIIVNAYFVNDLPTGQYTFGITIRPSGLFPISVSKRTHPIRIVSASQSQKP